MYFAGPKHSHLGLGCAGIKLWSLASPPLGILGECEAVWLYLVDSSPLNSGEEPSRAGSTLSSGTHGLSFPHSGLVSCLPRPSQHWPQSLCLLCGHLTDPVDCGCWLALLPTAVVCSNRLPGSGAHYHCTDPGTSQKVGVTPERPGSCHLCLAPAGIGICTPLFKGPVSTPACRVQCSLAHISTSLLGKCSFGGQKQPEDGNPACTVLLHSFPSQGFIPPSCQLTCW